MVGANIVRPPPTILRLKFEPQYTNFLTGTESIARRRRIPIIHIHIAVIVQVHVRDVAIGVPRTRVLQSAINSTGHRSVSCVSRSHRIVCGGSTS